MANGMTNRQRTGEMYVPVEVPEVIAEEAWASGTVIYRDGSGRITGYGRFKRTGKTTAELRVSFDTSAVHLLCPSSA